MQRLKFLVFSFIFCLNYAFACTVMFISKEASEDGSSYLLHLDDNSIGDQRIIYIPQEDHLPGSKKAIYGYDQQTFPRIVSNERSPIYKNAYGTKVLPPTIYIDEAEHTYKYFDGNYAIMNEHQLSIAETTGAVKYLTDKPNIKGRSFDIGELSRVALERCKTAKEAIKLMGKLAEEHGFFGWNGEVLVVADKEEGWVFEICSTPQKVGAMWVAKKIPAGEIYVTANRFRIEEIKQNDPNIMYSSTLFDIAEKEGYLKKNKTINWLEFVSSGEYYHPYYALRRIWRMLDKFAPSLKLSPWVKNGIAEQYPFSIKPDKKVSLKYLISVARDHYEGTEFDMTKGLSAGPFNNPIRYLGPYDFLWHTVDAKKFNLQLKGAWERPISFYHCGYVQITQLRHWLPDQIGGVVWLGYTEPKTCCLTPFYIGVNKLPESMQETNSKICDINKPYWTFALVANWICLNYNTMIQEIQNKQHNFENQAYEEQKLIDKKALELNGQNIEEMQEYLTNYSISKLESMIKEWQLLFNILVAKHVYHFLNTPKDLSDIGYPNKWLFSMDSYINGPTSYKKPGFIKKFFNKIKAIKYRKEKPAKKEG